ncbi:cupin domain-containing protein [Alteromonas confluentis]|uniref:JmjC domain-containing protein n=1 Tax=Alteromonas confluentis TaxID=1656094 RepID=A0A1E7Z950_9ALTE|nr:cupin domain-containing protein [Alteromonas confluentis]OFC70058.1 hypothetical protein BFC18_15095 [Alteromonas confluentis]
MYQLNGEFCTDTFLAQHWQKKPMVIREAFSGFIDPVDEHDLAGLAQEEQIDSRIVSHDNGEWHVSHGPFEDFEDVCKGKWTLLVQAVDRYINDIDALMEAFRFVPYWRMDDVMISFAVEGAGVGAHTDQYDVFLIQGKGSRRWRVAPPDNSETHTPHKDLQQVTAFSPTIDVVLQPGDMLYIPPGWAHDGVALEDCLTYSIGFRAPTQQDLLQQLADTVAEQTGDKTDSSSRYSDPDLVAQSHPSLVTEKTSNALKNLFLAFLNSADGEDALLSLLSNQHLAPLEAPEEITTEELIACLEEGDSVMRAPGCKPLYSETQNHEQFTFFINGEKFAAPKHLMPRLLALFAGEPLSINTPEADAGDIALLSLLAILISRGYWELSN